MVLQALADLRRVVHHRDAVRSSSARGPDAGKLQELRRVERAAGEDDLACAFLTSSPSCRYSTPIARFPSNSTLVASAFVSTRRFGRFSAGRR